TTPAAHPAIVRRTTNQPPATRFPTGRHAPLLGSAGHNAEARMAGHSQFSLLTQRRFLPYFTVQALGAFNDNVYRQAIIGLLFFMGVSSEERTLYTNIAPALFILPYFLLSGIAGQIAERMEKQKLIVV